MKIKLLALGLIAIVPLFHSCSNDDSPNKPTLEFVADGFSVSLKNANFYLTQETTISNRNTRIYFITDGTYTNANLSFGWNLSDYTDAAYYIGIQLGSTVDGTLTIGDFPQHSVWASAAAETAVGFITFASGEGNSYFEYYTEDDHEDSSPIKVSGGLDDGNQITIQFEGTLSYYYFNGSNWVDIATPGNFYFKGVVQDER